MKHASAATAAPSPGATGATAAAVALEGCRIWRPAFSGARVEIVSADARPRVPRLTISRGTRP